MPRRERRMTPATDELRDRWLCRPEDPGACNLEEVTLNERTVARVVTPSQLAHHRVSVSDLPARELANKSRVWTCDTPAQRRELQRIDQ